jgi:hypothetical protein
MDDRELLVLVHELELEHKDSLSKREVLHYLQYLVPLGWVTGGMTAGWVKDLPAFIEVLIVAAYVGLVIRGKCIKEDRNLESIQILVSHLLTEEDLPDRLDPLTPSPQVLKPHERFTIFLIFTFFASLFYFSAKTVSLTSYVAYLVIVVLLGVWTIWRLAKPNQAPRENTN